MDNTKKTKEKVVCIFCGKQYCNISTLSKHEELHKNNKIMTKKVKPLQVNTIQKPKEKVFCRFCGKQYTNISSLCEHEELHKNNTIMTKKVKPVPVDRFQCDFCNYKSDGKSSIDM